MPLPRIKIPQRLQGACIERDDVNSCWYLWLHTIDWKHGTYMTLHDGGLVTTTVVREDQGDDTWIVKR
jgi:hypothetical protein